MPGGFGNYIDQLYVGIRGDMTHLKKTIATAQASIKGMASQINASSTQINQFGRQLTFVSGALGIVGGLAIKVFADFEQSMANTFSVLGATNDEMKALTQTARDMGETTIFTASQSAQAMYYLASAGYDTEQIMGSLKGTLDLAAATQYDLAETTRIVVSAMNSYNFTADEASRVANTFSAIISASQATMDRLGDSLKYVAPIASSLGISLEQTTAALGLLYNNGLQASQAGTYLRGGLLRLQAPTNKAKEAMKALGISFSDINPQVNDLVTILDNFKKVGADARDKGDELADIFGKRAVTAFQVLIREGGKSLKGLEARITGTDKAAEMAEIQLNTLKGSFKLLMSTVQETAISIGDQLAPTIRGLVDLLKGGFRWFNTWPDSMKKAAIIIPAVITAIGLLVGPLALLTIKILALATAMGTLSVASKSLFGVLGIVASVLTAIAVYMANYHSNMEKSITAVDRLRAKNDLQISTYDKMSARLLELKKNLNRTAAEEGEYQKLISQFQTKYPAYLKNVDLESDSYDKVATALSEAKTQLKEYLQFKIKSAIVSAKENEAEQLGVEIYNLEKANELRKEKAKLLSDEPVYTPSYQHGVPPTKELSPRASEQITIDQEAKKLEKLKDRMAKLSDEVAEIMSGIGTKPVEPVEPEIITPILDLDDLDDESTEKIDLMKDVNDQILKEQLAMLEKKSRMNKTAALEYATAEHQYNLKRLNDEKELAIEKAKEQGDAVQPIVDGYSRLMQIEKVKHQNILIGIDEEYTERAKSEMDKRMEFQRQHDLISLEEHRAYLLTRLEDFEKWSDDWMTVLQEINDIEMEMRQENMKFWMDAAETAAQAISQSYRGLWSKIIGEGFAAKITLSDIFSSIQSAFTRMIADMTAKLIQSQIFSLFTSLFSGGLTSLPSLAGGVGLDDFGRFKDFTALGGRIGSYASGAKIDRSGLFKGHAGEMIVPASVVRNTTNQYKESLVNNPNQIPTSVNVNLSINNPSVENDMFWENVVEDYIQPAINKINSRS